jgi:pyruvate/2-oxoglutarate dehydrogenase complex dihydrolipoamide dehydrogenase (E3) component
MSEFSSLEIGAAHRRIHGTNEDLPTNCLSKLICAKNENERVVGFHYVGPNAGEITQGNPYYSLFNLMVRFCPLLKIESYKKRF